MRMILFDRILSEMYDSENQDWKWANDPILKYEDRKSRIVSEMIEAIKNNIEFCPPYKYIVGGDKEYSDLIDNLITRHIKEDRVGPDVIAIAEKLVFYLFGPENETYQLPLLAENLLKSGYGRSDFPDYFSWLDKSINPKSDNLSDTSHNFDQEIPF